MQEAIIAKYLTVQQAAQVANVGVRTIYKWIERRVIPVDVIAKPPGTGRLRFKAAAFTAWLDTSPKDYTELPVRNR